MVKIYIFIFNNSCPIYKKYYLYSVLSTAPRSTCSHHLEANPSFRFGL